jgi:hypothetical protein
MKSRTSKIRITVEAKVVTSLRNESARKNETVSQFVSGILKNEAAKRRTLARVPFPNPKAAT